jgi:Uma2 family endonuclease
MSTATSLMTFAEFEQLPDVEGFKRELVSGDVITMPPPKKIHSDIALQIQRILTRHFDWKRVRPDHNGYRIGVDNWLEPDVSVTWPDQQVKDGYFVGSPMIAVEVLSPGEEIDEKLALYLDGGAKEVWIVNYRKMTMSVFAAEGNKPRHVRDQYHSETLGVTITLAEIFQ